MRSLLLAGVVLCLTACSGASGTPQANDPAPTTSRVESTAAEQTRPALEVLFVGDSLADGFYASRKRRSFPARLKRGWRPYADVSSTLVAVPGARTWRIARAVEEQAPSGLQLAVLEAGANDVDTSTPEEFEAGYLDLLAAVEQHSPGVVVVCLGPWEAPDRTAPYERVLRRLCQGPDLIYAPLSGLFARDRLHGPEGSSTAFGPRDHYHPNDRGHAAIARLVDRVIAAHR